MTNTIKFTYLNHRGVVEDREIIPDKLEFIREPGFGYQSGWFLSGKCLRKNARRSFALDHIIMDGETVPKFFTLIKWEENND